MVVIARYDNLAMMMVVVIVVVVVTGTGEVVDEEAVVVAWRMTRECGGTRTVTVVHAVSVKVISGAYVSVTQWTSEHDAAW